MNRRNLLVLLIVVCLCSCTQRPPKPKPLLSERQMIELFVEIHLLEFTIQHMQNEWHNIDATLLNTNAAYSELFERFGLTQESFEANLFYRTYYSRDLERIFNGVADVLQKMHEELNQKFLSEIEKSQDPQS